MTTKILKLTKGASFPASMLYVWRISLLLLSTQYSRNTVRIKLLLLSPMKSCKIISRDVARSTEVYYDKVATKFNCTTQIRRIETIFHDIEDVTKKPFQNHLIASYAQYRSNKKVTHMFRAYRLNFYRCVENIIYYTEKCTVANRLNVFDIDHNGNTNGPHRLNNWCFGIWTG